MGKYRPRGNDNRRRERLLLLLRFCPIESVELHKSTRGLLTVLLSDSLTANNPARYQRTRYINYGVKHLADCSYTVGLGKLG